MIKDLFVNINEINFKLFIKLFIFKFYEDFSGLVFDIFNFCIWVF